MPIWQIPGKFTLLSLLWGKAAWCFAKSHWGQSCLQCWVWVCGLRFFPSVVCSYCSAWCLKGFCLRSLHLNEANHMGLLKLLPVHPCQASAGRAVCLKYSWVLRCCSTETYQGAVEEHGESSSVLFISAKTGEGLCSIFSPSFVQWDAMTFFSESIISQMFRTMDKDVRVSHAPAFSPGFFWVDTSGFLQWAVCSNWLPPCKTRIVWWAILMRNNDHSFDDTKLILTCLSFGHCGMRSHRRVLRWRAFTQCLARGEEIV